MVVDQMDNNFIDSLRCINKDIKKEYKSLRNRLQSILLDYTFLCTEVLPCFPEYPLSSQMKDVDCGTVILRISLKPVILKALMAIPTSGILVGEDSTFI